jgi:ankyrin repeat protein
MLHFASTVLIWACIQHSLRAEDLRKLAVQCGSGNEMACQDIRAIALGEREKKHRIGAIGYLKDESTLMQIAQSDATNDVKHAARARLAEFLSERLFDVVRDGDVSELKRMATLGVNIDPHLNETYIVDLRQENGIYRYRLECGPSESNEMRMAIISGNVDMVSTLISLGAKITGRYVTQPAVYLTGVPVSQLIADSAACNGLSFSVSPWFTMTDPSDVRSTIQPQQLGTTGTYLEDVEKILDGIKDQSAKAKWLAIEDLLKNAGASTSPRSHVEGQAGPPGSKVHIGLTVATGSTAPAETRTPASVSEDLPSSTHDRVPTDKQFDSSLMWSDPQTGLTWPKKDEGSSVNWQDAANYCQGLRLGGFSDWRMPNIDELTTIFDRSLSVYDRRIKGGIGTSGELVWSQSEGTNSDDRWLFSFSTGFRVAGQRITNSLWRLSKAGRFFGSVLCTRGTESTPSLDQESHQQPKSALANGQSGAAQSLHNGPIHAAVKGGDLRTVKELIKSDPSLVSATGDAGLTPLHIAVIRGYRDIAEFLLAKGADVNATVLNRGSVAPLTFAVFTGRRDMAEVLLAHGANVELGTPLAEASHNGHLDIVKLLVSHGANVNAKDLSGGTALHHAASDGFELAVDNPMLKNDSMGHEHKEILAFLLGRGADVRVTDPGGDTPLHKAANVGFQEGIEMLLAKGAEINAANGQGLTPLHEAIEGTMGGMSSSRVALVELMLASGANPNAKDHSNRTPLFIAAARGDMPVVVLLLQKGVEVNSRSWNGKTALTIAKENGHGEVQEYLSKHGGTEVDVSPRTTNSEPAPASTVTLRPHDGPIHAAIKADDLASVKSLIKNDPTLISSIGQLGSTPLHVAVTHRYRDITEFLLEHGADVNARVGDPKITPLCIAAAIGQLQIVEMLLSHGADPNLDSPLWAAARYGHKDIVELLIRHGANINTAGDIGTPLQGAANGGYERNRTGVMGSDHEEIMKILLAHGADVNATPNGTTPLHSAAQALFSAGIELLLSHGARVNPKDSAGLTPLICAVQFGTESLTGTARGDRVRVVSLLIAGGADSGAKDGNGRSPLFIAAEMGDQQVVALLLDKGAEVNARNSTGKTALTVAKERGHTELQEFLSKHGGVE